MLDFQEGVKIIKGCDFKISSSTTMAEAKEALEPYLLKANDRCISFMCNDGLNYNRENLIAVYFRENGLISIIDIHPEVSSLKEMFERKEEIAFICHKWLEANEQFSEHQRYDWGNVHYTEDFDRMYFMGIRIVFNREFED